MCFHQIVRRVCDFHDDDTGVSELSDQAQQRKADDVMALCMRQLPIVYGYMLRRTGGDRSLAEDLTQETFLAVVRNPPVEVENEAAWVLTIARRRLVDHLRRSGRRSSIPRESVGTTDYVWPREWSDGERRVNSALTGLPSHYQLVLILHHVDGLSIVEVARLTGRSVPAIESLLARARRSLRKDYERFHDD